MDNLDFLTPEDKDKFLKYVKQNPGKTYWKGYFVDKLIEKYYSNRFHSFMSSVMYLNNYEDAIKEYDSICDVMWGIISMMSDKIEVAGYFISGNIFKLIKEIDEMVSPASGRGNIRKTYKFLYNFKICSFIV